MKSLQELVRPNIWALKPYSCARDEFKGVKADAFLDANENPYPNGVNRYPDPLQEELKQIISPMKGVPVVVMRRLICLIASSAVRAKIMWWLLTPLMVCMRCVLM